MLTEPQKELLNYLGDPENSTMLLEPEEQMRVRVELARLGLIRNGRLTDEGWQEFELLMGQ